MPHMANLPWNLSYFFIFLCLFLMISKLYFNPTKIDFPTSLPLHLNSYKKLYSNNWKW